MKRVWFGLAASLTLAACEGELSQLGSTLGAAGGGTKTATAQGQREATVTRGRVRLIGEDGFCIDPRSTRDQGSEAFVVFGNCAAITGNPNAPQPYVKSIVTATVTSSGLTGEGAVAPQVAALTSFFRSRDGLEALSRSGDAAKVQVLNSFSEEGSVYLQVRDTSPTGIPGAQDSYWRAYFDAGASVVVMSLAGFADAPVSAADGLDVLRGFVSRNKRAPVALRPVIATAPEAPAL